MKRQNCLRKFEDIRGIKNSKHVNKQCKKNTLVIGLKNQTEGITNVAV